MMIAVVLSSNIKRMVRDNVLVLEQLKSAKEHIEITIDAEDYYRIKDSEKKTEE